jgi:hypothetical protein
MLISPPLAPKPLACTVDPLCALIVPAFKLTSPPVTPADPAFANTRAEEERTIACEASIAIVPALVATVEGAGEDGATTNTADGLLATGAFATTFTLGANTPEASITVVIPADALIFAAAIALTNVWFVATEIFTVALGMGVEALPCTTAGLKLGAFAAEAPGAAIGTSAAGIKFKFGMVGVGIFLADFASFELLPEAVVEFEELPVVLLLLDPEPEFVVPPCPDELPPEPLPPVPPVPPIATVVVTVPLGSAPGASVETTPSTDTVFALMYVWLEFVELLELKLTVDALSVKALAVTLPLFVIESVASKVNVVFEPAPEIDVPSGTVRFPDTATVTFAPLSVDEIALAIPASKIKSVGSNIQLPGRPKGADTSTTVDPSIFSVLTELVSIEPPLPPSRPPLASRVPPTVVWWLDQTLMTPPFPRSVEEASTSAPAATVTVFAKFCA